MKQKIFYILLLTSIFNQINAQLPDTLTKKVDAIFTEYDKTNSPGCALAILKDGKIIYETLLTSDLSKSATIKLVKKK